MDENTHKTKKDSSFLFSTSLIFNENIDRLWLYLRDFSIETKNSDIVDNFKLIKGDNTWTVGNVFSLYWVGVSNMEIKCISSDITRTRKRIKWKVKCDIGISYHKAINLYRITNVDKTLVKVIITRCENNRLIDINPQLKYYLNLHHDILHSQSNYLQSIKKDYEIYESYVFDLNYSKVWDFITNLKNVLIIGPEFFKNIEYNGPYNEVGTFIKINFIDFEKTIFLKIVEYSSPRKKKTYKCRFEAVGTDLKDIPHIIETQLNIIEENKIHLSFFYNFGNKNNKQTINKIEINIKKLINKIIAYIKDNQKKFLND